MRKAHAARGPGTEQKLPQDARLQRTLAALRSAFLALIEHTSLGDITVKDIVVEAGVSHATFYRHFATKDALLDAIATEEIRRLLELSPPAHNADDARASCRIMCNFVAEHRALWSALLTGGAASAIREGFLARAMQVETVQADGDRWLPAELGAAYGIAATVEILAWWLRQREDYPVERIVAFIDQLIIMPSMGGPAGQAGERNYRVSLEGIVSITDAGVTVRIGPADET